MGVYYSAGAQKNVRLRPVLCRMKELANETVSDEAFAKRHQRWPTDTPDTKEAYYIRETFDSMFPLYF